MKTILIVIQFLIISLNVFAQSGKRIIYAEKVVVHDEFRLDDVTISSIDTLSDFSAATDEQIATRLAIKKALESNYNNLTSKDALVYVMPSLADTASIQNPRIGDVMYVDETHMAIRENEAWLVFGFSGRWEDLTGVPADLLDGDQVDDADNSSTNEVISNMYLTGTNLAIEEDVNTYAVDLSPINNYDNSVSSLAATDYQDAIDEVVTLIPGTGSGGDVLYVSKATGDNSTAKRGSLLFPFKEFWTARDSAVVWNIGLIIILDGHFKYSWNDASYGYDFYANSDGDKLSLMRDGLTYYASDGVVIESQYSSISWDKGLFETDSGIKTSFLGRATFIVNGNNTSFVRIFNGGADIEISCKSIINNAYNTYLIATRDNTNEGLFSSIEVSADKLILNNMTKVIGVWHKWGTPDTLSNSSLNFNFDNVEMVPSWLINLEPVECINCDFSMNIGTLNLNNNYQENINNVRSLVFIYNSLINSKISLNIDELKTKGTGNSSLIGFENHSEAVSMDNSKIEVYVRKGEGNIKFQRDGANASQIKLGGSGNNIKFSGSFTYTGADIFCDVFGNNGFTYDIDCNLTTTNSALYRINNDDVNVRIGGFSETLSTHPIISYVPATASVSDILIHGAVLKNTSGDLITANSMFNINTAGVYLSNSNVLTNVNVSSYTKLE